MRLARGFSLASVMLLAIMAIAVAGTVAGLASFQLTSTGSTSRHRAALYLAEGAIAQAIDQIHTNSSSTATALFTPDPSLPDQQGVVTFDTSSTLPYSTNNFDGLAPTGYGNVVVASGMARLLGIGITQGRQVTVEATINVEQFPYALTANGALSADTLSVSGSTSTAAFVEEETANQPHALPASMAAVGSVSTSGAALVSGDIVLQPPNTAALGPGSVVGGTVRSGAVDVPNVQVTAYSTVAAPTKQDLSTYAGGDLNVTQPVYWNGKNLNVTGNLTLSNAIVYVDGGNLTVTGSVSGKGALIAHNGSISIGQGASLSAQTLVAVLATGDVTLSSTTGNYFQGLVWTGGHFTATNLTIAGTFVANPAGGSAMTLTNVKVVHVPETAHIQITTDTTTQNVMDYALQSQIWVGTPPPGSYIPYQSLFGQMPVAGITQLDAGGCMPYAIQGGTTTSDIGDSVDPSSAGAQPVPNQGGPVTIMRQTVIKAMANDATYQKIRAQVPDQVTGPFNPTTTAYLTFMQYDGYQMLVAALHFNPLRNRYEMLPPQVLFTNGGTLISRDTFDAVARSNGTTADDLQRSLLTAQQAAMTAANQLLDQQDQTNGTMVMDLDLNKFLKDTFPLHITSWTAH